MKTLPVELPVKPHEQTAWWEAWVDFVRNHAGHVDTVGQDTHYWGEHLFIGCETHKELTRISRAVGKQAQFFTDALEYHEVSDLRCWAETKPAPLLLHEKILGEHCYVVGPSGAGKSSLGIMPLLVQLMRGAKTNSSEPSAPYPVVILDLKGDSALFHTAKLEAARRKQQFRFFRTEKEPGYRFNPFRGFDRGSRSVAQLCQLILDALNLNHGKGYGRSYYTERSRNVLSRTLNRNKNIQSFDELHTELRETVAKSDIRTKGDAFELLSIIEMLREYRQLVTDPDETIANESGIIFMPTVLKERQVAYFWLPAALESISVGEIAKLVLFNLRVAAQDWKQAHPRDPRNVILVIDELQRVAGENLQGILQDARSFGIHAILANQSLTDLKSPTGFDLGPTIMTNTRVKFFFTSPSEQECYVYVERGKGFTPARQFPQKGNPWLKDLSPEEFAYHVRLAWPVSLEEYQRREALPMPTWDEIPGGNFYRDEEGVPGEEPEAPKSNALPRDFKLIRDEEWEGQIAAVQALFRDEPVNQEEPENLTPADINRMRQAILDSIADRGGPDISRRIINLLFDNHLKGVQAAPTWRGLWMECWREPIDTRRGADTEQSAKVRQAISRVRDIMDRFFETETGRRWPLRAVVEQNEYRIRLERQAPDDDGLGDSPFIDSQFPGVDDLDEDDES